MTNEQRRALTELQEKIINQKLSNSDISWVETEEEMHDLKQAIIKEGLRISESNNIVFVSDYFNHCKYMIFDDGFMTEKKVDYSSSDKTDKIHKISGIMILGWLVLMFILMGILTLMDFNASYAVYVCIVLGIINLIVFRLTAG
ncbi:MAG TPA: hypothetical protein IAA41_03760 [Candidatus Eubacterium faecavium]|nr:hypothetical protein [Candidatus Eubacterium faecavium]